MLLGDYEKLNVWKKSHALTCEVYRATAVLSSRNYWPLGDQMRRSSLSVGTNVAEGCGRNHPGHFRNSLTVALGEANELHYLLLVARDVEAIKADLALGCAPAPMKFDVCAVACSNRYANEAVRSDEEGASEARATPNSQIAMDYGLWTMDSARRAASSYHS